MCKHVLKDLFFFFRYYVLYEGRKSRSLIRRDFDDPQLRHYKLFKINSYKLSSGTLLDTTLTQQKQIKADQNTTFCLQFGNLNGNSDRTEDLIIICKNSVEKQEWVNTFLEVRHHPKYTEFESFSSDEDASEAKRIVKEGWVWLCSPNDTNPQFKTTKHLLSLTASSRPSNNLILSYYHATEVRSDRIDIPTDNTRCIFSKSEVTVEESSENTYKYEFSIIFGSECNQSKLHRKKEDKTEDKEG